MFLFLPLQEKLAQYLTPTQITSIVRAFLFAADAHEDQFRSSGEPYITHPVAVACVLASLRMDPETIMASLLHDVVEDTEHTIGDIREHFGEKVAELVNGVTKLLKIKFSSKAEAQAENFRKMMLAMVEDVRVIIIKLADRIHNMRTLGALRPDKRCRIALETLEIYAPIANRLGMHGFRNEFQELGFKAMYPLRYKVLEKYVEQAKGNRQRLFNKILTMLRNRLIEANIEPVEIEGRQKRLYSIYRKMHLKGLPFSEIMDVYAYRVAAGDQSECYRLLGVVHSIFKPIPGRFKDYIAIPKANGYQSLHTTLFGPHGVPIEIQIRTAEMDSMAENGIAAHWLYQSSGYVSTTEVKTQEWLKQLLDMQQHAGTSMDFIENVKIDLYPDEVYVFTPQGDIMELPKGATPIDFAYAVHTEVGDHCAAAKVNRRHVPLSYVLSNGQTVEISTSPNTFPSPSWLNFMVTGKAKGAINHYLKQQQSKGSVELGRQLLTSSLSKHDIMLDDLSDNVMQHLLTDLALKNIDQLFIHIGLGERSSPMVATQIASLVNNTQVILPLEQSAINIAGTEGLSLHFADCCYPIPGDDVIGLVSAKQGLVVHMIDCPYVKAQELKHTQDTLVNLSWSDDVEGRFKVRIQIELQNMQGMLARIASILTEQSINIQWMTIKESEQNYAVMTMIVEVTGRKHLARLLRGLKHIPTILRVFRIRKNETDN